MRKITFVCVLSCCLVSPALHAQEDDADALAMANQAISADAPIRDWRLLMEGAWSESDQRYGVSKVAGKRLSADFALDTRVAPGLRLVVDDRLDWYWQNTIPAEYEVNMLKELYVSWLSTATTIIDVGRINVRYGAAIGYNPTDFFRANANRSIVSIDPGSLRNNRLGSVMLRSQWIWKGGSVTALVSPKLSNDISQAPFNPDLGATNNANRWLLAAGQQFSENFNPQLILFGESGQPVQAGMNLTRLVTDAASVYLEWSGGRAPSLAALSAGTHNDVAYRNHLSTGFTYTFPWKVSITLESQYNGAGANEKTWNAFVHGPTLPYQQYRQTVQQMGEFPTKSAAFLLISASDLLVSHFDLTFFARQDLSDQSRLSWAEARYHWRTVDLSAQFQRFGGTKLSDFGASQERTVASVKVTFYH